MFNFFKKDNSKEKNEQPDKEKSIFKSFKSVVSKTSDTLVNSIISAVSDANEIDEFTLDDIETLLIKADLGVDLSTEITDAIRVQNIKANDIKMFLKTTFNDILSSVEPYSLNYDESKLNIYFITGVNGAGKTTLIGKLAYKFKNEGKKVLLAAGDTFRAAAEEQLDIWAKRADVDIVRKDGVQSAAVIYESIEKAKKENYNVLIIDTAGRLQNKFNLIEELKKARNVITKNAPDAVVESMLVLDANLGQNGLSQAKVFSEAVSLTSTAVTKLDGSARGGIIISIAKELNLPCKLVGIGENIEDLKNFNKDEFIDALF